MRQRRRSSGLIAIPIRRKKKTSRHDTQERCWVCGGFAKHRSRLCSSFEKVHPSIDANQKNDDVRLEHCVQEQINDMHRSTIDEIEEIAVNTKTQKNVTFFKKERSTRLDASSASIMKMGVTATFYIPLPPFTFASKKNSK